MLATLLVLALCQCLKIHGAAVGVPVLCVVVMGGGNLDDESIFEGQLSEGIGSDEQPRQQHRPQEDDAQRLRQLDDLRSAIRLKIRSA